MSKKIFICASDLAVITGHNPYKSKDDIILKYWKKHYKTDYLECVNNLKNSNVPLKIEETNFECIKRLSKKYDIDIQRDLSKCLNTKNIEELNTNREVILNKIKDKIPNNSKEKDELEDSINRVANTNFGVKFENKGIELYVSKTSNRVEIDRRYHTKELFHIEYNDEIDVWFLGGKVDGIVYNSDNSVSVLEIKNRVKGLFNTLRDYEKVQCYAYMYLLDLNNTHLAETLKSSKNKKMNILNVDFETDFWENSIENKIEEFVDDFYNFLDNPLRKNELLSII